MTVLRIKSRTDAEGHVDVPVGVPHSNVDITVIVTESTPKTEEQRREEWRAWVESTAGSISDPSFFRHPQGEYPEREQL